MEKTRQQELATELVRAVLGAVGPTRVVTRTFTRPTTCASGFTFFDDAALAALPPARP